MKYRKNIAYALWLAGLGGFFAACNDDWDNHYGSNGSVPEAGLMELIRSDGDLSAFCLILEKTGADTLLSASQTYTVWAPVNGALSDVDMGDMDLLRRMVSNHIARYSNPTSTGTGEAIYMLNGKVMSYDADGAFAGVRLADGDILARNGVLHKLSDTIPYRYNFMEYISSQEKYSSFYGFIDQFTETRLVPRGTAGDSVEVDYNPLLESYYGIGLLDDEDSVYTMILPDNEAWAQASDAIGRFFNVYRSNQAEADSICEVQTGQAILSALTFGGRITDPGARDSLVSVPGYVVHRPGDYFAGYRQVEASNGLIYEANGSMNLLEDTCVWNGTIVVEGEDLDRRRSLNSGTSVYVRDVDGANAVKGISEESYLEVSGSSLNPGVTFDIPEVLSGTYDIYVDFVPPRVDGTSRATEKTCLTFRMGVQQENGRLRYEMRQGKDDEELIVGGDSVGDTGIKTVKVWENYHFPTSDFRDPLWYLDEENTSVTNTTRPNTTLEIRTNVSNSELNVKYVRRFRVDRIRLVPSGQNKD